MSDKYVHALRFKWLTRFYDPLIHYAMRDRVFKQRLVDNADIQPGHRVLDVGCGTGTLTIMLKQSYPKAHVVGLDGDSEILKIAKQKAVCVQQTPSMTRDADCARRCRPQASPS